MRKVVAAAVGAGIWGLALPALAQELPKTSWQTRFERDKPSIVRAIDGVPGPAGYERETHFDRRRMIGGSVLLGLGTGLQLALVSSRGFEASELIPCAGVLNGDYGQRSSGDSDFINGEALGRALLLVPICAAFLGGVVELGRGFLDPRPVWVKSEARAGSVRVGAFVTGKEARLHALGYF